MAIAAGLPATLLASSETRHLEPPSETPPCVDAKSVGTSVQVRLGGRIEPAIHAGQNEPDAAITVVIVLVAPQHRVVGGRLESGGARAIDVVGDRVQEAQRESTRKPAGNLGGAEDLGRGGRVLISVDIRELRGPPDPARIEQSLTGAAVHHHHTVHIEGEEPLPFHEERPPLTEEGLEGAEVEFRWVGPLPGRSPG